MIKNLKKTDLKKLRKNGYNESKNNTQKNKSKRAI
jgi:hypothetical protein